MKRLLRECAEYIRLHPDNDVSADLLDRIHRELESNGGASIESEVSREDIESAGYDAAMVDDDMLDRIAESMGEDHTEYDGYWEALRSACIAEEIPPLPKENIYYNQILCVAISS